MRKLIVLLLAACAACSSGARQETPAGADAQPARPGGSRSVPKDTLARIRLLAGSAACTEDAQCHSLALGAQPCGGPEGYLAWSDKATPAAEIRALGEAYQLERRSANAASSRVSTCRFLPDPGAVCSAGACQLGSSQAPGAAVAR